MKTAQIRDRFLQFFSERGHAPVESAPLVPAGDRSLLFTNSGMVQFKDVFLGFDKRPYDRAVTAQRCLRAGGKHNDLENVGYTARHHTFFEMLGNFSFGDYFKAEAIPFAWEFLTSPQGLGIDRAHLWVTVFGGGDLFGDGSVVPADEEAAAVWHKVLVAAGFSDEEAARRIVRISTADNFWMMGDVGPCGPCSEIFYDRDAAVGGFRGADEAFADECVEVWNLVFMQYNRDGGGLSPLPKPCVDTGMGLERIGAVMQGVASNYEIDLLAALVRAVGEVAEVGGGGDGGEGGAVTPSHRVVADHIRAAAFLIADGVMPSNDGRGYVLRRIVRRALRHLSKIRGGRGGGEAVFWRLAAPLAELMGDAYPLLRTHGEKIAATLKREEENFAEMLKNGMTLLADSIRELPAGVAEVPGETVFRLYDTFGFPPDMTAAVARDEYGLGLDEVGFEAAMARQRSRSRAAAKFNGGEKSVGYDGVGSEFLGYDGCRGEGEVVAIFVDGARVEEVAAGGEALVVLSRTAFYGESGGQVGDTGVLTAAGGRARVGDTRKIRADAHGHAVRVEAGRLRVGDAVLGEVDAERRVAVARAHSAAHLMHAALRQVLGRHVEQRGSYVAADAVRFDFSHGQAVTAEELREVARMVNRQIAANAEVCTEVMAFDEALKTGAMALFGEKYGEVVRVVTIDADFSVELCGGTHARRAGDVGFFQFVGEAAIAAGIRRVEARTADAAVVRVQTQLGLLSAVSEVLKVPVGRVGEKVALLREQLRAAQRQVEALQEEAMGRQAAALAAQARVREGGGGRVLVAEVPGADGAALRRLAVRLRGELAPAAVFLAGGGGGGVGGLALVAAVSPECGVNAREWLAVAAAVAGARGGGKADLAQAGGGDAGKCAAVLEAAVAGVAAV